jgi:hypothetical protein
VLNRRCTLWLDPDGSGFDAETTADAINYPFNTIR